MSTRRRVEFELVGTGANIEALLNRVTAGINRVGSSSRQGTRELGLMDRQLMAIGTTVRYAFAGAFVFGITGAIGRLTEFQNKLGQVAALAGSVSGGRYRGPSQNLLGDIGSQAIVESNRLGIAVGDIEDYMTRFYSSFDQARGQNGLSQMRQYVDEVGRLQASLGTEAGDPQQLAGGIAGLVNQIPGGKRSIGKTTNRVSNLIYELLARTPNITGRDVSRDIGRVGATMTIANMTPEQAFAVWASAGSAGGSSSVIGRGVAQLLGTSLLHPTTPAQKRAFAQAGLPTDPTMLRSMGGFQVLEKMMGAVAPHGARVRNVSALGNEDIPDESAVAAAGVKGVNLTLLYNLLGRQESVRQFINLLANDGVRGLQDFNHQMKLSVAQNRARDRENAAMNQRALARLGTALSNIPLSVVRGPANATARAIMPGVSGVSSFLADHRTTTNVTEGVLGAALGVAGARRMLRTWRSVRKGKGALADAAGAAITTEEMPNLLGGGVPDGSRGNPMWVMISPASWYVGTPGGMGAPSGGGGGGNGKSLFGMLKSAAGYGAVGWRALGIAGAAVTGGALAIPGAFDWATGQFDGHSRNVPSGHPLLSHYARMTGAYGGTMAPGQMPSKGAQHILNQFASGMIGAPRAESLLRLLDGKKSQGVSDVIFGRSEGSMDVTVRLVDAQGRTIATQKKGGVPVKWWQDTGAPTSGGKPGKNKGSH